jgi:hypothetical protein
VGQRGYPIKVALVTGVDDLAETPELLRRPQRHADLVASQVQLEAPVVVVSPYGLGVAGPKRHFSLGGVEPPQRARGDELARTAIVAVRKLAAAAGRPLPAHVPPAATLRAGAAAGRDDGSGVNVPLLVGLFAIVFVPSVLLFEVWTRARREG